MYPTSMMESRNSQQQFFSELAADLQINKPMVTSVQLQSMNSLTTPKWRLLSS